MGGRTQVVPIAMAERVGIEISPSACRIVQLDRVRKAEDSGTIVRSYAVTPSADAATLALYKGLPAAVVAWGLQSDHRQAVVTVGSYSRMRREAVSAARQAGVDTRHMLADIAPISATKDGRRRPVVSALARTTDVASTLKPLTSMGVRVTSIVTPAIALMSLSRLRRRLLAPGMAEAYVALEQTTTAIALVRDGALIAARELAWGFMDAQGRPGMRDDVAGRLTAAIRGFLDDCGAAPSAVAQVCVCGGMPELRNMTLGVMEQLDIEVEPLDSLFGIDEGQLPAEDFRERAADMRLAWAAAADWDAPINFLRERRQRLVKTVLTRAAIVAGIATGLGIAWRLQQSGLFEPSRTAPPANVAKPAPPPSPSTTARARPAPVPVPSPPAALPKAEAPRAALPKVEAPPITLSKAEAPRPALPKVEAPPVTLSKAEAPPAPLPKAAGPSVVLPKAQTPPAASRRTEAPPALPPVVRPVPVPPAPVAAQSRPSPPPAIAAAPPARPVVAEPPPRVAAQKPLEPEPPRPASPRRVQPAPEVPIPFQGTLGTILYGADRKLAIVDGRIVQVGDDVGGAKVVEITPNSVLFRDRKGQLRRLGLEDSRR